VNCALDAIIFLAPNTIEHMAHLDSDGVQALARRLTALGASARWINRFVPVIEPGADPRTCCPHRFAHLKLGERQALRQAYAALLAERVARNSPPIKISPPPVMDVSGGSGALVLIRDGCLFCGVGYQSVTAAEVAREGRGNIARAIWTPRRTAISSLAGSAQGGSRSTQPERSPAISARSAPRRSSTSVRWVPQLWSGRSWPIWLPRG
jgi:hypothetical protein